MDTKDNVVIIKEYIDKNKQLSEQTQRQYIATANQLGFSIKYSEPTIIKYIKNGSYSNPNTKAGHLNIIILARNSIELPVEKLKKYRNSLKSEIATLRKKNMTESKKELPSYDELIKTLNKMTGIFYIYNYNIITYGLRNKDQNLRFYTSEPDKEDENYIIMTSPKSKKITLVIHDYKTSAKFKTKNIIITDSKFIKELAKRKLSNGDYLMAKKDGGKLQAATFNERIKDLTIDKIGEADMFKIVVSHFLKENDWKKLEGLVYTRGVSITTMMKSYNLHNNSKSKAENEHPTTEGEFNDAKNGETESDSSDE